MCFRLAAALLFSTVLAFGLVGRALAGGWAVTTLDALPEAGFQAGTTYRVGYTIRQHGDKPFAGARSEIRISSPTTGETVAFPGAPDGPIGHYVAEVRFPAAGVWNWDVTQEPFGPQTLGTIRVAAPVPGAVDHIATQPSAQPLLLSLVADLGLNARGWLTLVLPLATLFALGLLGQRLASVVRRRRAAPVVQAGTPIGAAE